MIRIIFIVIVIISFSGNESIYAGPGNNFDDHGVTWELTGGYSLLTGYYESYFSGGYHFASGLNYPLYSLFPYFSLAGEVSASSWGLSKSDESVMYAYSVRTGMFFTYPLQKETASYLGLFLEETFLALQTEHLQKQELTYKPGFVIKFGLKFVMEYGAGIRAGFEYEMIRLSGRFFNPVTFTLSATFNYTSYLSRFTKDTPSDKEKKKSILLKIQILQTDGIREIDEGNIRRAIVIFKKIIELDPGYEPAAEYLAELRKHEDNYKRALKLIGLKRYFDAIPILIELSNYMNDARSDLVRVRKVLASRVPFFEKNGISAYENREYDRCIIFMKKIKLIDPGNKIAEIYLPRSIKRKQAIEKLR